MNLFDLNSAMHEAYNTLSREEANKTVDKLYFDHFHNAIIAEGFTRAQASIIDYEAYERGHSGGCQEIVVCAMGLVDFAKKVLEAK